MSRLRARLRPLVSRLSGSVRARVVSLGLLAAIPSVGMAAIIAGQDFRSRENVAVEQVERIQARAIAQVDVAITALGAGLSAIAATLPWTACDRVALEGAFGRFRAEAVTVIVFGPDGRPFCQAGARLGTAAASVAGTGWFQRLGSGSGRVLGTLPDLVTTIVAVPTRNGGALVAVLPDHWFDPVGNPGAEVTGATSWFLDTAGNFVAARPRAIAALPSVATLMALRQGRDTAFLSRSAGGVPYAYAAMQLANGWQLITAYDATAEHTKARRVLFTRLADLVSLLLLGLAVTVLGADIAFGDPLRRLRGALLAWQQGAHFDEKRLALAPTELVELAHSFAQATTRLQHQKAELDRAEERQALLMLEIHHRVKNNLQIVASLLNLQASRIRQPEARLEFQSARDRVRALATLHRHLYAEGDIHTINMASFLEELCGQLMQAMAGAPGERIKLLIEAEEVRLSTDQAVPLSLIVTEAVTNAIKYGFPNGRSGRVDISFTRQGEHLELVIADDGVGIPPGRGETESGVRDGIGLQLIRGFSRQLNAVLEVRHEGGTRYSVRMPLHPKAYDPDADAALAEAN